MIGGDGVATRVVNPLHGSLRLVLSQIMTVHSFLFLWPLSSYT